MAKAKRVHSTPRRPASKTAANADPIFRAIDNHRQLFKAGINLYDRLDRAEQKAAKKFGRRPIPLIAWRNYSAIGGSEIEARREEFLKLPSIDPKKIEKEYLAAKARERAVKRAERAWDKRAGLALQHLAVERAISAEQRAAERMARTKPRTPAGAAAMLAYVKANMEEGEIKWHSVALQTIVVTLAAWAKVDRKTGHGSGWPLTLSG
jgi:hypothetical protein